MGKEKKGGLPMNIGFIGLGNMGAAIAPNLIRAGHALTVFNRTRSRTEGVRKLGATVAETVADLARGAETVITMVSDDRALGGIVFDSGGLLQSLPAGAVHICMSTISVSLSRRLAEVHGEHGQHFLAAPVFGRPEAAAAAKLFVVLGGPAEQVEKYRKLFDAVGQKTFLAGAEAPAAHLIKLTGNFLITTVIESLAEAMALVRKQGIDPNLFLEIMTGSLFTAPVYQTYGRMLAADNFEPVGFKMPLGLKDNRLLLAAAEEVSVSLPLASLLHDRFLTALARGMGEADWAAIARISFRNAGL